MPMFPTFGILVAIDCSSRLSIRPSSKCMFLVLSLIHLAHAGSKLATRLNDFNKVRDKGNFYRLVLPPPEPN